jgi:1-acyl-sn-glycerol-3-phosphate acyltransferase
MHDVAWSLAQRSLLDLGWLFFGSLFRLRVEGRQHLPAGGGVLVVCNHPTVLDPVFLTLALPRPMTHLVKPLPPPFAVVREFYRVFGCIETGGGHRTARAMERCARAIEEGRLMVVFPEGGVSARGVIKPFQPGAARLALATGCPVVPAAVCGSYAAWPAGRAAPRPGPVTVRFGAPLGRFGGPVTAASAARLSEHLRQAVDSLYSPFDPRRPRPARGPS